MSEKNKMIGTCRKSTGSWDENGRVSKKEVKEWQARLYARLKEASKLKNEHGANNKISPGKVSKKKVHRP